MVIKKRKKNSKIKSEGVLIGSGNKSSYPVWCFKHIKKGWGLESISDDKDYKLILDKINNLSNHTRSSINLRSRKNGLEKIPANSLKTSLPQEFMELTYVLSIRFSSKKRIVGSNIKGIFHILFIDKDHKLY